LFILVGVGFAAKKMKMLTQEGVTCITEMMLYIITPCLLIHSFQREFNRELLGGFLIAAGAAVVTHIIAVGLSKLLVHDPDKGRQNVLRFGAIFANCGYMALPLQQALLGSEAVFYGASYNAIFNMITWSYGLRLMCNGKEKISARKALLNPGTISVVIGLVLFFASVTLPPIIGKPIEYLSVLNTPLPMIIIGYYIACLDFRTVLRSKGEYMTLLMRLVIMPLIELAGLYLLGVRGTLLVTLVISAGAPIATISTMFAAKYDGEAALSASCVATTTLGSILSMTLIVGLAKWLA